MTSSKDNTNQRLKLLTFPSLASITLAACGGGDDQALFAIDYQNTLLMDGDDPIGLVQQPLEHSMVTVNLVADLLVHDDYDATLNDIILFWSSELG